MPDNCNQKKPTVPASFEDALAELERIVAQLEGGEKTLEESLTLYERGVLVLKRAHEVLDKAERRLRVLVRDETTGGPALRDADEETLQAVGEADGENRDAAAEQDTDTDTDEEEDEDTSEPDFDSPLFPDKAEWLAEGQTGQKKTGEKHG